MNVRARLQCFGTLHVSMRALQSEVRSGIPGETRTGGSEAGTIEIISIFVCLTPGKDAALDFEISPDGVDRRNPKRDMGGILPVMRNRSIGIIHRTQAMHECGWAEGRLSRITKVEESGKIRVELLRIGHRHFIEEIVRMLPVVERLIVP